MIDIKGIDKATLVAGLFNNSKPFWPEVYTTKSNIEMTPADAQIYLDRGLPYFNTLHKRVMKVDVSGDEMNPFVYDSVNGPGAAALVVETIKKGHRVTFKPILTTTEMEAAAAAGDAKTPDSVSDGMSAFSYK